MSQRSTAIEAATPGPTARRALAERICPSGVVWLTGLSHPEAARASSLPFIFAVGRVRVGDRRRTVHEVDLVLAGAPADEAAARADLESYARFVVAHPPTQHARLTGQTAARWAAAAQ